MTDHVTTVSQDAVIDSPEKLVLRRELRGMSQSEAAQRLKLAPRQLNAIERGDWAALPGRAFTRGAIRSYGRLLEVDVAPLLQSVGDLAEASEALRNSSTLAAPLPPPGAFGFAGEGRGSTATWVLLGVATVIALGLFFGRSGEMAEMKSWLGGNAPAAVDPSAASTSAAVAPAPPSTTMVPPSLAQATAGASGGNAAVTTGSSLLLLAPPVTAAVPASATAGATVDAPTVLSPASADGAAMGAPVSATQSAAGPAAPAVPAVPQAPGPAAKIAETPSGAPVAVPASTSAVASPVDAAAASPAPASAASAPVRLLTYEDAWVEVRQGDGKVVHTGTIKAGSPASIGGVAPFSLVIGNAAQVRLEFEGRPVNLKPTASGIARVKLQ